MFQTVDCFRRPPMSGAFHAIPARLVLPMIVPAAEREPVLRPDDLRAPHEAARLERGDHDVVVHRGAPDVGDVTREQRPCFAPVGRSSFSTTPIFLVLALTPPLTRQSDRIRRRRADP